MQMNLKEVIEVETLITFSLFLRKLHSMSLQWFLSRIKPLFQYHLSSNNFNYIELMVTFNS